jgi:hypothetical protein
LVQELDKALKPMTRHFLCPGCKRSCNMVLKTNLQISSRLQARQVVGSPVHVVSPKLSYAVLNFHAAVLLAVGWSSQQVGLVKTLSKTFSPITIYCTVCTCSLVWSGRGHVLGLLCAFISTSISTSALILTTTGTEVKPEADNPSHMG